MDGEADRRGGCRGGAGEGGQVRGRRGEAFKQPGEILVGEAGGGELGRGQLLEEVGKLLVVEDGEVVGAVVGEGEGEAAGVVGLEVFAQDDDEFVAAGGNDARLEAEGLGLAVRFVAADDGTGSVNDNGAAGAEFGQGAADGLLVVLVMGAGVGGVGGDGWGFHGRGSVAGRAGAGYSQRVGCGRLSKKGMLRAQAQASRAACQAGSQGRAPGPVSGPAMSQSGCGK